MREENFNVSKIHQLKISCWDLIQKKNKNNKLRHNSNILIDIINLYNSTLKLFQSFQLDSTIK